ncbi:MAG: hypothetical protein V4665_00975 [Patescibacteria group bacterium]
MKFEFKGYYWIVTSDMVVRRLGRLISLGSNAMGITFYPFLFVRADTRNHRELIRHETIHIQQQLELFIIGAWVLFILEYAYARLIKKLDRRQAYYFTALEQEAHRNAADEHYLCCKRRPYDTLFYIKDKKRLGRNEAGGLIVGEY